MMDNTIERRTNNLTHVETMFDARRTPWDGLGKRIAGAVTSRDAIRLAGLDWNVVPTDIVSEATGLKIPGYKANVRDIDNKTLGIVTERYKIVQNEEAFSFTDALLGEGVRYETAGALQSGKKVWMLARLEGRMITDEKIDPFLVFTNSHDGKGSVRVAITPVRVWCQNTLNLALKEAERQWVCKHTGRIDEKLVEAKYTLMNTEHYLRFTPEDVKELSDDAKEYEFKVFMGPDGIDGPCLGKMRVTENSADEAYSVMLDIIGCRLAEAFPELDIPYSIELVEESEDA